MRLAVWALIAKEELNMGELAEILGEPQPNITRYLSPLKQLGLIALRKQGTRVFAKAVLNNDAVLQDALEAGRKLCQPHFLKRLDRVIASRDSASRAFFESSEVEKHNVEGFADEMPAYIAALSTLMSRRKLAIDVGTGDGRLLDVLGPAFEHVIGIDTSRKQLEKAHKRVQTHGHSHVELLLATLGDASVAQRVRLLGGADAIFFSRVIHHMSKPLQAFELGHKLLKENGEIVILDYGAHDDETLREHQADQWLGFDVDELNAMGGQVGFEPVRAHRIPEAYRGQGPDHHLPWFAFTAQKRKKK